MYISEFERYNYEQTKVTQPNSSVATQSCTPKYDVTILHSPCNFKIISTKFLYFSNHILMAPATTPSVKRGPGRPKGSKNKADAGTKGNPVGRPRKRPLTNDSTDSDASKNHENDGE